MLDEISTHFAAAEGIADHDFVRGLAGQDRFAARKAVVARLEELELVEKIEPHTHMVPHGDRSGVPIEPRLTLQWYVDAKTLAGPAIRAVESGQTVFSPKQFENTFFAWMRDIQPWCISRQLWWGHQIPAWYAPDGEVFVAHTEEEAHAAARTKFGHAVALTRDEDVLDTWFSSALWPFSTIGWPEKTPELAKYYPGDVLVTGWDIIFFWVARMMMRGIQFMGGRVPFKTVCIHGLVRDEKGQKMSKSRGNVMDPLELVDAYGADALRFTLCALAAPGRDIKLGRQRVESYRSFATKIWNAARFCEMNGIAPGAGFDPASAKLPLSRWILDATNAALAEANAALEGFRFDDYAKACYRFAWNDFCDWFLEFAKPVLNGPDGADKNEVKATAAHVLGVILRLLHPVMPFITEELWHRMGFFFGMGDKHLAIRRIPGGDLVAPPKLARNAPGLDVTHPGEEHVFELLWREHGLAGFHRMNGRGGECLRIHIPLQREPRFNRHARPIPMRDHMGVRFDLLDQFQFLKPRDNRLARREAFLPCQAVHKSVIRNTISGRKMRADFIQHHAPFRIQHGWHGQIMAPPNLKIIEVMGRRDLDRAGALFGIGIFIRHHRNGVAQ